MKPPALAGALVGVSLPVFVRDSLRARDPDLFWTLAAAHGLKLAAALPRFQIAYRTYGGFTDAEQYHQRGVRRARGEYEGTLNPRFSPLVGSNFIRSFTGVLYRVIGPSRSSGFLAFSWLGFWGQYMFHRAFATALPDASSRTYSRLVLFWPSVVFWPSSIGKDAWMMFSLGTGAHGAARGVAGLPVRGLDVAGVALAGRVRPHVAALLGAHTAAAYLAAGRRRRAVTMGALAALQAVEAVRYTRTSGIDIGETFEETTRRTSKSGGSRFSPPDLRSPAQLPLVPLTVLFRPHLLEAHNLQARAAAVESTALLGLSALRARSILAALRGSPREPYLALALGYSAAFCAAFAGFANFGLLARQRVQLLPFYFVLLSARPRRRRRAFRLRRT